jgi:uncharacterized RDD family membrane protein YckC
MAHFFYQGAAMNTPASGPLNPYAPPRTEVRDIPDAGAPQLAPRLTRLGAALLELLITGCVFLPLGLQRLSAIRGLSLAPFSDMGAVISLILFTAWLGLTLALLYRNGQTVGKRLLRIKITRTDGSRASLPRLIFLRGLLNGIAVVIPYIGYLYSLADVLFIFSESRQCLHDRIADTLVVKA